MLNSASDELQKEKNWYFFKNATPGSLQLSEALLVHDPENSDLLAMLAKGFASYGYVVYDTEHLAERVTDQDSQPNRQKAILAFAKGLNYGFRYLQLHDIDYPALQKAVKQDSVTALLDQHLAPDVRSDLETVFFTGTAWLLLANYKKDDMFIASQVTQAFELIKWVCHHKPDYQAGLCQTMEGVFHLARPPMMGGKPKTAQSLFQKAMQDNPENILIPVTYLEWYVLPRGDEKTYRQYKTQISKRLQEWRQQVFVPGREADPESSNKPLLNLFNAMAERRFDIITASEREFF